MGRLSAITLFLFTLLLTFHYVSADAEYERAKELMQRYASPIDAHLRGREEDLSFCYGENSICAVGNDLFADCDAYDNDYIEWYKCLCGNGYVAVNQACYWCQLAYHLDIAYAGNANTEGCSSASVTIAPIPASVLSVESNYNITYTGIISGAGAAITGSAGAATTTGAAASSSSANKFTNTGGIGVPLGKTTTSSHAVKTTSAAAESSTSTSSKNAGITSIVTVSGGGSGQQTTNAGSSPTTTAGLKSGGDSPGGAPGLNSGIATVFSVLAFGLGLSVLYLI